MSILMPLAIFALFSVSVMAAICGAWWLHARRTGWARLAGHYRDHREDSPRTFTWRWQSLRLGEVGSYSRCVTVFGGEDGLTLRCLFPIGHAPLFFPWSELALAPHEVEFTAAVKPVVYVLPRACPTLRIGFSEALWRSLLTASPDIATPVELNDAEAPAGGDDEFATPSPAASSETGIGGGGPSQREELVPLA